MPIKEETKKTPLQVEIAKIYRECDKHKEAKAAGVILISKLKSKVEGRGTVPQKELNRLREAFKAKVGSLEESSTKE